MAKDNWSGMKRLVKTLDTIYPAKAELGMEDDVGFYYYFKWTLRADLVQCTPPHLMYLVTAGVTRLWKFAYNNNVYRDCAPGGAMHALLRCYGPGSKRR